MPRWDFPCVYPIWGSFINFGTLSVITYPIPTIVSQRWSAGNHLGGGWHPNQIRIPWESVLNEFLAESSAYWRETTSRRLWVLPLQGLGITPLCVPEGPHCWMEHSTARVSLHSLSQKDWCHLPSHATEARRWKDDPWIHEFQAPGSRRKRLRGGFKRLPQTHQGRFWGKHACWHNHMTGRGGNFLGGAVVKNLSANARDTSSIPGRGRSYSGAAKPVHRHYWACAPGPGNCNKKQPQWKACVWN